MRHGEDGMWDENFSKAKFEFGRVIPRDHKAELQKDLEKLSLHPTTKQINY